MYAISGINILFSILLFVPRVRVAMSTPCYMLMLFSLIPHTLWWIMFGHLWVGMDVLVSSMCLLFSSVI